MTKEQLEKLDELLDELLLYIVKEDQSHIMNWDVERDINGIKYYIEQTFRELS